MLSVCFVCLITKDLRAGTLAKWFTWLMILVVGKGPVTAPQWSKVEEQIAARVRDALL